VKNLAKFVSLFVSAVALGSIGPGHAQQAPKGKNPPPAAQATPAPAHPPQADAAPANASPPPGWLVRCTSASRDAALECAMEQTAVLTKTGQLIILVNIRVPNDTRAPIATIQLPLGLNLPAGAKLQIDDGKMIDLQIQTCEQRGCYVNAPIPADILAAMKSGKQLKVSFQNLAKEVIAIPMPLTDFATAYDKIK
jgi:invasion protein IalB